MTNLNWRDEEEIRRMNLRGKYEIRNPRYVDRGLNEAESSGFAGAMLFYYYVYVMAKIIGYMITWTMYGRWLQGDERGYVKKGEVLPKNKSLRKANIARQAGETVKLNQKERRIVLKAIEDEAKRLGQKMYSIAVCSNHIHLVLGYDEREIGELVRNYKNAGYFALRKNGFIGRVWTKGYDKRYCYDEESLKARTKYVVGHKGE